MGETYEAMQESLDRQMEGMVGEEAMSYFKPVRRMLLRQSPCLSLTDIIICAVQEMKAIYL